MFRTTFYVLYVIFFIVALALGIFGGLLAKEDGVVRLLEAQGFSDIKITDREWFAVGFRGCENTDSAKFNFTAIGPNGDPVTDLFVCKGLVFKGYTLRGK